MKLTTIKFINLIMLVLSISMTTFARADTEDECQNQSLKPQGMSVAGNTITPEQNVTIPMVSDKGKVEATLELTLNKTKNGVVVNGVIKNSGNCEISTFMPVSLHPIKNGLPLGWHSLPEGLKLSNPTLKPQQFVKFFKNYSKEYIWGFNIKLGTYTLSNADASDDCSDKSIAKQLEKIADKETSKELDACQSAEAMNRVNNEILSVIANCKSKMSQQISKEVKNNISATNHKTNQACANTESTSLGKASNNVNNTKSKNNQAVTKSNNNQECSDEELGKRVQAIADLETQGVSGICDSARAMKRVYEKSLKVLEPCVERSKLQEVYDGIEQTNQTINGSCG